MFTLKTTRSLLRLGVLAFVVAAVVPLLWLGLLDHLFVNTYMPHGHCYLWQPGLVGLHLASDSLIALSYFAISFTLAYLVGKASDGLPFHWMFLAFGVFIIACGFTHLMEVVTVWTAVYWLSGYVKLTTAAASLATAVALPPLVPKAFALLRDARLSQERKQKLEAAYNDLETLYERTRELDELKTQFFANVSHELRTPLALILGPTEKLLESGALNAGQRRDLEVIERNARTLLKHVNDLLDVSKLEAGEMRPDYSEADVARLLRLSAAHFDTLAEERRISLSVDAPPSLVAQVDAEKLQRVFLNLLSNAFKFSPAGGRVLCTAHAEGGRIVVTVRDDGPGVPANLREEVFERFRQGEGGSTRRFGGTGLGLSLAKEFVDLHGGTITIDEAPGGGALFTIQLPLRAPDDAAVRQPSDQIGDTVEEVARRAVDEVRPGGAGVASERGGGAASPAAVSGADPTRGAASRPLVLVVDDNPEMNAFIGDALAGEYRVESAANGREGLEKAVALAPDLILTDVMMPEMSGDELVREVRAREGLDAVPIVVLTAKADEKLRVGLLVEGAQDYLSKPFSIHELHARVGNLISMKRTRDVLQQELATKSQDVATMAIEVAARKRELQAALKQAEAANRLKDEFLATVSHELRTPLGAILGWTRMLRGGMLDAEHAARALETIERNVKSLTQLVEDLLDVSRIVTGKLRLDVRPTDLAAIVEAGVDSMRPAAEAKSIHLEVAVDRATGTVSGDPDRLQQIVWNLVSNAIKFTPMGGRVEIRLGRVETHAEITVSDTGMGINPDFLPFVFEPFRQQDGSVTRAHGGLGLGLGIVRRLVELHGGTVHADSPGEGQGARFIVMLPLIAASTERQEED